MSSERARAEHYWDVWPGKRAALFWWSLTEVQRHINAKVSGDASIDWLAHTLQHHLGDRLPLERCLSLGCGTGSLERRLARLGAFRACDAYDLSRSRIKEAQEAAQQEGLDAICYRAADVNTLVLPASAYDAVWVSGAMHHFEKLEHVSGQIRRALRPAGLLIMNEYIGPARFQFPERQKKVAALCLELLPQRFRTVLPEAAEAHLERARIHRGLGWVLARAVDKAREGDLWGALWRRFRAYRARNGQTGLQKAGIDFPSPGSVAAYDPSEAVRSDAILEILGRDFEIVEKKDWGGNVLQFLLADIAGNFAGGDTCSRSMLHMLIDIEETMLQCGEFESDFAYLVLSPRARA